DKRVLTWDLNNLGTEYTYPTSETDSRRKTKFTEDPCLKFVHGGHTNRINEVAVHPKIPDLFASVGDDTLLEVFKPKTIVEEEEEENEGGEKQEEKENASKEEKMDVDGKNDGNKEGEKEEADAEKSS
ncbi:hypothetical protein DND58_29365, partial [Pseudomonas syringae pv. pisi]